MAVYRVPTATRRRKSVSFGAAASGWFVLEALLEKNDSSHATIHCLSLLISSSTATPKIKGKNAVFLREDGKTTTIKGSFGAATT